MDPKVPKAMILAAFATIYLVWGSTYLAIRVGLESFPPFLLAGARCLLAGIPMYAVLRLRGAPRPSRTDWARTAALGALLLVGGTGLVTWAEMSVPSGLAALLVTAVPIWMALLDWLVFDGGRPTRGTFLGLVAGPVGILILLGPGSTSGRVDPAGAAMLLLAGLSWAVGSLLGRRWTTGTSALQTVAMEMITGGVGLALVGTATGEWSRFAPSSVSLRSGAALAYLTLFGSIIGFSAYSWLLRTVSSQAVSTYALVNPVVAVVLGWSLGGEALGGRTLVAAAVIITAVVILQRSARPPVKALADSPRAREPIVAASLPCPGRCSAELDSVTVPAK